MIRRIRQFAFVLTPPILAATLLAGIVNEQRRHIKPADVEPYHARAKAAMDAVPYVIGEWTGRDDEITPAAQKLLRPNAILNRAYQTPPGRFHREASLLIVQCRDSRDMVGHFPPICYRAHGMTAESFPGCSAKVEAGLWRDWPVGNETIPGVEYRFTHRRHGEFWRTTVYNFFIVPQKGMVRDMQGIADAAEDYQQRYYGAAQFQVVFTSLASEDLSQAGHDEIFATLLTPNLTLIQTLTSGGLQ